MWYLCCLPLKSSELRSYSKFQSQTNFKKPQILKGTTSLPDIPWLVKHFMNKFQRVIGFGSGNEMITGGRTDWSLCPWAFLSKTKKCKLCANNVNVIIQEIDADPDADWGRGEDHIKCLLTKQRRRRLIPWMDEEANEFSVIWLYLLINITATSCSYTCPFVNFLSGWTISGHRIVFHSWFFFTAFVLHHA